MLRSVDRIELVACGTAYYASLIGAAAIERLDRAPGSSATVGSEFRYRRRRSTGGPSSIAVTQSGETADTIAPVRLRASAAARSSRSPTPSARPSPARPTPSCSSRPGPEIGVAASKTFVTQVTTLVILRRGDRAGARHAAPMRRARALGAALRALPGSCRAGRWSDAAPAPRRSPRRYVNSRGFMFVGRGASYPAALEGALKLKEVSYVHAEGYAAGELKHGPISLLDAECPARRGRDPLVRLRQAHQQRHGGPRARRSGHRRGDRGRPPDRALRRRRRAGSPTRTRRSRRSSRSSRSSCSRTTWRSPGGTDVDQPRNLAEVGDGRVGRVAPATRRRRRRTARARVPPGTTEARHRHHQGRPDPGLAGAVRRALLEARPDPGRSSATSATGRRRSPAAGPPRRRSARCSGSASAASAGATSSRAAADAASRPVRLHGRAARARRTDSAMGRIAVSITHESDYAVPSRSGAHGGLADMSSARHRGAANETRAADPGSDGAAAGRRGQPHRTSSRRTDGRG